MRHRVLYTARVNTPAGCRLLIKKAIRRTLRLEGIRSHCTVGVLITGPEEIRLLNRDKRGQDAATDVLSFPAMQLEPGSQPEPDAFDAGKTLYLGDMAINLDRAREQAGEYEHSLKREVAYLAVHSALHLLGYDHMDEGEQKRLMRDREEKIMQSLSLMR